MVAPTLITRLQVVIESANGSNVTLSQIDYISVDVVPRSVELDGSDQRLNVIELNDLPADLVLSATGQFNYEYIPGQSIAKLVPHQYIV